MFDIFGEDRKNPKLEKSGPSKGLDTVWGFTGGNTFVR